VASGPEKVAEQPDHRPGAVRPVRDDRVRDQGRGLVQAREFMAASGANGIVLTKLDGTAKGGVIISIQEELGVPVKYVGVGEEVEDLQAFEPERFVQALFEN